MLNFHPLNWVPVQIKTFFEKIELGPATGFFYKNDEQLYLVTNWHVVSGKNSETNKIMHSQGAIPNRLKITLPNSDCVFLEITLYEDSEIKPLWYEHPKLGSRIDIAVIPLKEKTPPFKYEPITPKWPFDDIIGSYYKSGRDVA